MTRIPSNGDEKQMPQETEKSPYGQLCQLIASRRLQPGDRVPSIRDLAGRFSASIVAVRDALVQAEREGLVEIRPRSGAFIRSGDRPPPLPDQLGDFTIRVVDGYQLHLCHAREILEVEVARQAAERCRPENLLPIREALGSWMSARTASDVQALVEADCTFHIGIAQMAGNPVLVNIVAQCLRQQFMQECMAAETADDSQNITAIHMDIYEALRDRNPQAAGDAMRRHMKFLEHDIQQMLYTPPDQSSPAGAVRLKKRRRQPS